MMTPDRAVFLSYASQDAEAAKRICEALRTAGVEVWFDQSELRGGDAWDAKIRKQIKECALFVPIVSANTQARREGYFRIEWKLAALRTHAIAEGTPFLLPVVIDDTPEPEALVPGEFREVQWTRLRDDSALSRFCARLRQLLDDSSSQPDRENLTGQAAVAADGMRSPKSRRTWTIFGVLAAFAAAGVLVLTRPWSSRPAPAGSNSPDLIMSRTAQLAQRSRIETRDVLDFAVERAARTATTTPDSAVALATLARLEAQYLVRGWDVSEQRRQDTQTHAKRALVLDPGSADAMFALAVVLLRQGAFAEAETLVRTASARQPDDAELRQALGTALSGQGREAEALRVREENLRLFPRNPFAHYDLALSFESASPPDLEAALRKFDDSLALQRFTSTVLHKASLLAGWRGDLAGARRLLDELDPLERTGDRAVGVTMAVNLLDRRPERAIEVAGLTARNYLDDDYVRGPKAWLLAHAQTMVGRQNLALAQWREAETVLRQRLRTSPGNWFDEAGLAVTLAWLGENAEGARLMTSLESLARESPDPLRLLYVAYYHAGLGDAAKAADCLESVLNRRELVTAKTLPLDPWWNKLRGKPEFDRLVATSSAVNAERGGAAATPAVEPKSVAVLAFVNKSDDPGTELFSDGLSEDLIGVLGRVPGLTVTGWTSSLFLKNKNLSTAEIGKQLGVSYLVRGSVYRSGNTVRITAQVSRAATDVLVWACEPLERDLKDSFKVRDEIAALIAQALSLKLGVTPASAKPVINPEAYRLYLEGREGWRQRDLVSNGRAESLFRRALELEPNFARAWSGLADVWANRAQQLNLVGAFRQRGSAEFQRIEAAIRRALELDPDLAEAHRALAVVRWLEWKTTEGIGAVRQALKLNPNDASAHQMLGRLLMLDGRMEDALAALRRAHELDPLFSRIADNYSLGLLSAGRPEQALTLAEHALELQPGSAQACRFKVVALAELGRVAEFRATAARYFATGSDSSPEFVAYAFARMGDRDEARRLLASFSNTQREPAHSAALLALGNHRECLEQLDAGEFTAQTLEVLLYWPVFDEVRNDPAMQNLLSTLGLNDAETRARTWRAANRPQSAKK